MERQLKEAAPLLARLAREAVEPAAVLNALHTLDGLGVLRAGGRRVGPGPSGSRRAAAGPALRRTMARADPRMLDKVLGLAADREPMVRLQLALSLGESRDARALSALVQLARAHGDEPWMAPAILTAVPGRGGALLAELLRSPAELGKAEGLLEPLCAAIANRRHGPELSQALVQVAALKDAAAAGELPARLAVELAGAGDRRAVRAGPRVRQEAVAQSGCCRSQPGSAADHAAGDRNARRAAGPAGEGRREVGDVRLSVEARLAAVAQLAADDDPEGADTLLAALPSSTPQVREAILGAILGRRDRLPALLDALEAKTVPASFLSAVQRAALLDAREPEIAGGPPRS